MVVTRMPLHHRYVAVMTANVGKAKVVRRVEVVVLQLCVAGG